MEFEWDVPFDLQKVTAREIEESFEDPFSLRLLPEHYDSKEARYFCLGRSMNNRPIFSLFWTDGKRYRVLCAREMSAEEAAFYDRKNAEML